MLQHLKEYNCIENLNRRKGVAQFANPEFAHSRTKRRKIFYNETRRKEKKSWKKTLKNDTINFPKKKLNFLGEKREIFCQWLNLKSKVSFNILCFKRLGLDCFLSDFFQVCFFDRIEIVRILEECSTVVYCLWQVD